jgi:hypothetical protein
VIGILSDNSTSTFYLNRRVRLLNSLTHPFVERCLLRRNIIICVYHTPGQDIVEMGVDGYSRGKNPRFRLSSHILQSIRQARRGTEILFPLFKEIPKVLDSSVAQEVYAVVMTPIFPTQTWWPKLLELSSSLPIVISKNLHNLIIEETEKAVTRRFLL